MKKNLKKLFSLMLAATMLLVMSATAFAETVDVEVRTDDLPLNNHTYAAYQILSGTQAKDDNGNLVTALGDVKWGNGIDSAKFLSELKSNQTIGPKFTYVSDAASFAEVMNEISSYSEEADLVAQTAYKCTVGSPVALHEGSNALDTGYYLIIDNTGDLSQGDAYNSALLQVTGNITIYGKTDIPTVEKKVKENVKEIDNSLPDVDVSLPKAINDDLMGPKLKAPLKGPEVDIDVPDIDIGGTDDGTDTSSSDKNVYGEGYNDVADYNIGDAVPFKLIGTVPATYNYEKYPTYVFHDESGTGLTVNAGSVSVYYTEDKSLEAGAKGTTDLKDYFDVKVSEDGHTLTVSLNTDMKDLVEVKRLIEAGNYIVVSYTATLNENATIGLSGNEDGSTDHRNQNSVVLEYTNTPNIKSGGEPGTNKTKEDKTIVFTYELDTIKFDEENSEIKLPDAKFVLFRLDDDGNNEYAIVKDRKVTGWTSNKEEAEAAPLVSGSDGLFKVIGLDDGIYYLEETVPPKGYNLLKDPVKITISAKTANNQRWDSFIPSDALTHLEVTVPVKDQFVTTEGDINSGIVEIKVLNNKGAELPSTGGVGTTLFYIIGAILVLGAGVVLITRRRMSH